MNILVQLSHPAHFHSLKYSIKNWRKDGHKVFILIKTKDILEDLLRLANEKYYNILPISHRKNNFGIFVDMLVRDWKIFRFVKENNIDFLVGSTPEIAHVSWLTRKRSMNIGEDDASIVGAFVKVAGPFIKTLIVPNSCNMGCLESKTIHYPGFQKLAYLHPKYFTPDKEVVRHNGIDPDSNYFILRFASLSAHHDYGVHGISTSVAERIISVLSPLGQIYISSERPLEKQFEEYRLCINPLDIHHVMSYATLYIGDSQSMANEAAMLGTPSIRFNDFVGEKKIGVMEELEHSYKLTYGISSKDPGLLYAKITELLSLPNIREIFHARRDNMLNDKIDVTSFFTWLVETHPFSAEEINVNCVNPNFWDRFR